MFKKMLVFVLLSLFTVTVYAKYEKEISIAKQLAPDKRYMAIVDYRLKADKRRFILIDIKKNTIVYRGFTSHGKNSGLHENAVRFSNVKESFKSSLGIMRVSETYYGKNGYSVKLDGLTPKVNTNVRKRVIVLHPGKYVSERYMLTHKYPGRSLGCITLDPRVSRSIIDKLKNGGLIINIK